MRLHPFPADEAVTVASWCGSPEEAAMWCGHRDGLVPAEKIRSWADEDGVRPFGLVDDAGVLLAYGELWGDDGEAEGERARRIVDPRHRGRGGGRTLVTQLADRARLAYPDIFMRVHPDNAAALACYARAGFVRVDAALEAEWNAPQPVDFVWLRAP
jgi:ribosomal protein S18 acetylase RimI-like enzyme